MRVLEKNILDLEYNKYLQFSSSVTVILSTFFVGLFLALISHQIDIRSGPQLGLITIVTVVAVAFGIVLLLKWKAKMNGVIIQIKNLDAVQPSPRL